MELVEFKYWLLFMSNPTEEELRDVMAELISCRDRLTTEILSMSKKLNIPRKQTESILDQNDELRKLKELIDSIKLKQKKGIG